MDQPRYATNAERPLESVTATQVEADDELVRHARRGDLRAFEKLVDGRLTRTFRRAMAILGNEADARDATQDIFVRVWRNLPELREVDRFDAWFGRIVVNTCRSAVRDRGRRQVREIQVESLPDRGEGLSAPGVGPADRSADIDVLERALDRLSGADRTILALHHYEHLSLAEIATLVAIPTRTVKSRLFSARRSLERALEAESR